MNNLQSSILNECLECIRAWKSENDNNVLDIHYDDYVNTCYNYGGAAVRDKMDELLSESSDEEQQDFYEAVSYTCETLNRGLRYAVGNRLKYIRTQAGMTGKQLAELSGMTETTINKIEKGRWSVSIDLLEKILNSLNAKLEIVCQPTTQPQN